MRDDPAGALQYAASEGFGPLREMVAAQLKAQSAAAGVTWNVDPAQVLITTGSQQGLDLVAKILIDKDSKVLVESPTYLGAVMALFATLPYNKFAHGIFRTASLLRHAVEKRQPNPIGLGSD